MQEKTCESVNGMKEACILNWVIMLIVFGKFIGANQLSEAYGLLVWLVFSVAMAWSFDHTA
jgi:hypothetical protein